jgi:hypothetical protein
MIFTYIEVFKHFTLLMSLIKIDLVLNIFFVLTATFFSYQTFGALAFFPIDLAFLGFIVGTAHYAIQSIVTRNEKGYFTFSILRIIIELIKIVKAILILMEIDAAYTFQPLMGITLGNLKFSILI